MRLRDKALKNINEKDILYLLEQKVPESRFLDYKKELPGNSDGEKKEFLADISSFANTSGGVIIYGIEEEKDEQGSNTGIPKEIIGLPNFNLDKERLRLESSIRDGLDPRLNHVEFVEVLVNQKNVLVIGIPRSLLSPHMVSFKKDSKFHARNNSGKFQLDAREIGQAFLQTSDWEKEAENFRRSRSMEVRSQNFLPTLMIEPVYMIHILPLGKREFKLDLKTVQSNLPIHPEIVDKLGARFNLDGYLAYHYSGGNIYSYVQYFRNGAVEIYIPAPVVQERENRFVLYGSDFEKSVLQNISFYLRDFPGLGIEPPYIVFVSYFGLKGVSLSYIEGRGKPIDQDAVLLPGVMIDSVDIDLQSFMQPIFDMFWQVAGWEGSPNFKHGTWSLSWHPSLE